MEKASIPCVVGVGAANFDLNGRSRKSVVMRDSNPGYLSASAGGVTRNILENLARQGVSVSLLSAVGDDAFGGQILSLSRNAGIDVSRVRIKAGASSSGYVSILDDTGDMLLGMSDMRIIEDLPLSYLSENAPFLHGAAAIVCDACLQPPFLAHLLDTAGNTPVFIDPVSTAYARQMRPLVGRFYCVKPNEMELSILADMPVDTERDVERAAERLLHLGAKSVAVSRGDKGCYYAADTGERTFCRLKPVSQMVNATGAGDAFMAGLLHGFIAGLPLYKRLSYALASGIVAILSLTTISPDMSDALIYRTMAEYALENT